METTNFLGDTEYALKAKSGLYHNQLLSYSFKMVIYNLLSMVALFNAYFHYLLD